MGRRATDLEIITRLVEAPTRLNKHAREAHYAYLNQRTNTFGLIFGRKLAHQIIATDVRLPIPPKIAPYDTMSSACLRGSHMVYWRQDVSSTGVVIAATVRGVDGAEVLENIDQSKDYLVGYDTRDYDVYYHNLRVLNYPARQTISYLASLVSGTRAQLDAYKSLIYTHGHIEVRRSPKIKRYWLV